MVVVDRAVERVGSHLQTVFPNQLTSCHPRKVDLAEVTHAVIPVDKMPALSAYSANCTTRPVVDVGRAGADDIGRAGRRAIVRLEVGGRAQDTSER